MKALVREAKREVGIGYERSLVKNLKRSEGSTERSTGRENENMRVKDREDNMLVEKYAVMHNWA